MLLKLFKNSLVFILSKELFLIHAIQKTYRQYNTATLKKTKTLPTSHSFTLISVTGSSAAFSESWFFLTTLNPGSRPTPLTPSPYMSGLHWMKKTYRCSDLQEKQTGGTMKPFTDRLELEIAPCWLNTTGYTKAHWNTPEAVQPKVL